MPKTRRKRRKRKTRSKRRKKSRKRRGGRIRGLGAAAHRAHHGPARANAANITTLWDRVGRLIEIVNRCHPDECRGAVPIAEPVRQAGREIAARPGIISVSVS